MPALPAAPLVVAQAQQLLALPEAGLDGPARAGQMRPVGTASPDGGMAEEDPDRIHPGLATQHEPDVGTRQAAAGGDHPPDDEVGLLGAAAVPGTRCRVQASAGSCASMEGWAPGASRSRVRGTTVGCRSNQTRVSTGTSAM